MRAWRCFNLTAAPRFDGAYARSVGSTPALETTGYTGLRETIVVPYRHKDYLHGAIRVRRAARQRPRT